MPSSQSYLKGVENSGDFEPRGAVTGVGALAVGAFAWPREEGTKQRQRQGSTWSPGTFRTR